MEIRPFIIHVNLGWVLKIFPGGGLGTGVIDNHSNPETISASSSGISSWVSFGVSVFYLQT